MQSFMQVRPGRARLGTPFKGFKVFFFFFFKKKSESVNGVFFC